MVPSSTGFKPDTVTAWTTIIVWWSGNPTVERDTDAVRPLPFQSRWRRCVPSRQEKATDRVQLKELSVRKTAEGLQGCSLERFDIHVG